MPETSLASPASTSGRIFEHVTPNWFASVMGTGIVANAAGSLPQQFRALHVFAVAMWLLASAWLIVLSVLFAGHWLRHRDTARANLDHPVMGQFYGAVPMALLTVGAGTLTVGSSVLGTGPALAIDWLLWTTGTGLGLLTSLYLPFAMITRHDKATAVPLPAWLMPIVPPMVSATTGAVLIPHVPAGQARLALLLGCYACFGLSLFLGLITLTLVYGRLVLTGMPALQAAPTVWISLGMIGQSITAANVLARQAPIAVDPGVAAGLRVFGIGYGVTMGGFGALFFALAVALTVHAARRGLRFSLTWWSFTFPIGTCVTGAAALSVATGSVLVRGLAGVLFVVLVTAWATVALRTGRSIRRGTAFVPA